MPFLMPSFVKSDFANIFHKVYYMIIQYFIPQLYRFLARRTDAKFNEIVLRRLFMSKINRPPMSLARLARNMKKQGREGKTAVVIGTVTNDLRIFKVPKMTVSFIKLSLFSEVVFGVGHFRSDFFGKMLPTICIAFSQIFQEFLQKCNALLRQFILRQIITLHCGNDRKIYSHRKNISSNHCYFHEIFAKNARE